MATKSIQQQVEVINEAVESEEVKATPSPQKKTARTRKTPDKAKQEEITKDTLVSLMNIQNGRCHYKSKRSGAEFVWAEHQAITTMPFDEVVGMHGAHPKYLKYPFLMIVGENAEAVIEKMRLTNDYDNFLTPQQAEELLMSRMDKEDFRALIKQLPLGLNVLLIDKVRIGIKDGTFDSLAKKAVLEEEFRIELDE